MANELEQAQEAYNSVPSYVQRYANNPFLYSQEEQQEDAYTLIVTVSITDLYTDLDHLKAEVR